MLSGVKINFSNGALGSVSPSADCVSGMVATGSAVTGTGKLSLGTSYILYKLDDLVALGVTSASSDVNASLYKDVKDFYEQVGDGAELWLMVFPSTAKQSDLVDKEQDYAKKLIQAANGRIRTLIVSYTPAAGYSATITDGLDADVKIAMKNAQVLGEWATNTLYAPLFTLLQAREYDNANMTQLADLTEMSYDRVAILIGDTITSSKGAAIGILAGKIASIPVQRHIGRVKDGALVATELFIGDKDPYLADVETLNNKGYITFRTFTGKAGYFFSDDCLATEITDDYRSIAHRRTIDKAYRIAYKIMLNHVNDEIPVKNDGTLVPAMCKSWQQEIVSGIYNEMTSQGELGVDSTDSTDKGVKCFIDYNQNILSTSQLNMSVQVKPYGYAKYININLGFMVTTE